MSVNAFQQKVTTASFLCLVLAVQLQHRTIVSLKFAGYFTLTACMLRQRHCITQVCAEVMLCGKVWQMPEGEVAL